jgi:hypothetical protein
MKTITNTIYCALAFACFGLFPNAQAVVPPPDGGYPGFNTAEGQNALLSLTSGVANTAVGWFSLESNTDGSFNTAVGGGTLLLNVGDQSTGEGTRNTAVGAAALLFNLNGSGNTAVGVAALLNNTDGLNNNAVGGSALNANTSGQFNNAYGNNALQNNIDGNGNSAFGDGALASNVSGSANTAIGEGALINCSGDFNVALGNVTGTGITTGSNIIAIGSGVSGVSSTNGELNDSCYIGNIHGAGVDAGTTLVVFVDQDGKLGTTALPGTGNLPNFQDLLGKVQELETTVAQQAKAIEVLRAQLKEEVAQMENVSAQPELSKPGRQIVLNDRDAGQ